ncbi:MAG: squalene/phytoene synthase family protein, partial [Magnetococcales bacterium]|nr:squalene/phytoene synthase family protein [Magnetococcales bacterium]
MSPEDYCRRKVVRSGSSFLHPLSLLPPDRRRAMMALYAFCREVDDIVDRVGTDAIAEIKLAWWQQELEAAFRGEPHHPVAIELRDQEQWFGADRTPFFAILEGMAMDIGKHRYQTLAELSAYCEKVAVAVGRLTLQVFTAGSEIPPPPALFLDRYAHHLGHAFQLTNILRDVAEDLRMGRVYLPLALLQEAGCSEADLLAGRFHPGLEQVMARLGEVAET